MLLSSNILARGLSRGSQESLALRIARVSMGQSAVETEVLEHDFCVESVAVAVQPRRSFQYYAVWTIEQQARTIVLVAVHKIETPFWKGTLHYMLRNVDLMKL